MADHHQQPRRETIEKGEAVSAYHAAAGSASDTDTDDEDARYYLQSSHDNDLWGSRPASSLGSDGTVSDVLRAADPAPLFPCRVCGREFSTRKGMNGHMKVHGPVAMEARRMAAAFASAAARQASAVEEVRDSVSTPVVVAAMPALSDDEDAITPVESACSNNPVAVNGGSSSARSSVEPSPTVASVLAAPPAAAAPEQQEVQEPVAPAPAPLQQVPAAPQQVFDGPLHLALVPSGPSTRQLAPAENGQRGFSCRECGRWFATHQGLGGHAAGHKNRRIAAEAAAAAAAGIDPLGNIADRGGAREVKVHKCKQCDAEFPSGVSLGGHMRKHYVGEPIVPKKRQRPCNELRLPEAERRELALGLSLQREETPAMGVPIVVPPLAFAEPAVPSQPAQAAPAVPAGGVRIFGVTFVPQAEQQEEPPFDEAMNEQ